MTREPDIAGRAARAWRLPLVHKPAVLAAYLVHRPKAHPMWDCYVVAAAHLREEPGLPKAALQFPEATHEVQFITLDPTTMPKPNPEAKAGMLSFLTPLDLVWQFTGTDEEAERLVVDAVTLICRDPGVSPDSDYAPRWKRSFAATLAHYRNGGH